jgi:hypothetical protein
MMNLAEQEAAIRRAWRRAYPYGLCPRCGAPGVRRERRVHGNDQCERGHEYPSAASVGEQREEPRDE